MSVEWGRSCTTTKRRMLATGFLAIGTALLSTGCAFGTNRVTLPPTATVAMPASGGPMGVEVRDVRGELSGPQVGYKRNGYGAKTGSVELSGNEALADRLARDIVSLLRSKGYRAQELRNAAVQEGALVFGTDVTTFIVDVKHGFFSGDMQGIALLKVQVVQPQTRQVLWEEIVRAEYTKPNQMVALESDHQEVIEKLYAATLTALLERIPAETATRPAGLPPLPPPAGTPPAPPPGVTIPPSMATPPPPVLITPSLETVEQAQAKCWANAGSNSALKEKCAAQYGPRPAYGPPPVRPATPASTAPTPPAPTMPPTSLITPAKKAQIDLLQRLRDSGSITGDQFEIERAKIILGTVE
jgi:hypothetical protein